MASNMEAEVDDPIVQEMDVYLSKQLSGSLYLFQYPVRPKHVTYDESPHLAARIKPKQQRLELELLLDSNSINYSKSKGEQIALNVDGKYASHDKRNFETNCMDKQILTSSPSGIKPEKYVIGYYKDRELFLTPLKGIVQLRPGFSYLDTADAKQKALDVENPDEEDEAKPITVRFARRETEEAKARRLASFENVNRRRDEEPWVECDFHGTNESDCEYQLQRLVASHNNDIDEFQTSQNDYLNKLLPKVVETEEKKPPMPNNVLSLAELKNMSLSDQVKALLINAKVIKFSQLMSLLPKGSDPIQALRCVQQSALLVQGCWVVKSDILYPEGTFSAHSSVPAESLIRARDYIMWRFTQNRFVIRKDISTVVKIPAEDVKDMLEQMAHLQVRKGWEFLLDLDSEFLHRHSDIVQRQQMVWDAKFNQLKDTLRIPKADLERKAKSDEQAATSPIARGRRRTSSTRSRTKSQSISDFSDGDGDHMPRSRHSSGHARARRQSGATSERQRKLSGREAPNPTNIVIKQEKMDSQNGDLTEKQELDGFVLDKISTRRIVSLSELKQMISFKLAHCSPGHVLSTGVSEKNLEQSVLNAGAKLIPNQQEPVFALVTRGDGLDHVRNVVLEWFASAPGKSVQIQRIRKILEEKDLVVPPIDDLRNVIKEYCSMNGKVYVMKCALNVNT